MLFVRRVYFCYSFLLLVTGVSLAQPKGDSVRQVSAPTITITSELSSTEIIHPNDVAIASAAQLRERTGAIRLSEALPVMHPSIDVRNYGSLGGISLLSFRGLPSEYTSIYWQGLKITDQQKSLTDLALLDMQSVSSIGIVDASNAILIGGDVASVGLILNTTPEFENSLSIGGTTTSFDALSSFLENRGSVDGSLRLGDSLAISGGITSSYSNGSYPFLQQSTGHTILRENNDAHLLNSHLATGWTVNENLSLSAFSFYTRSERGAPGAVTTDDAGASDLSARQYDENFLIALSLDNHPLNNYTQTISAGYSSQYETYTIPNFHVADRYENRIFSFAWKALTTLSEVEGIYTGLDYTKNTLASTQNSFPNGDSSIHRESYSAYITSRTLFLDNFDLTASLRTDLQSFINKPQVLPTLSLRYQEPQSRFLVQASYSRLFHAPTFNELYWRVGGNPNLNPEKGIAYEVTAIIPFELLSTLTVSLKATAFQNNFSGQIIWVQGSNGYSIPVQVSSSITEGLEFICDAKYRTSDYEFQIVEGLSLDSTTNYSPIYFGKALPYSTPMHSSFLASIRKESIGGLSLHVNYRGHRFTDFYNLETGRLPPVMLIDFTFTSIPIMLGSFGDFISRFSILNLGNISYNEVENYPLPGRSFRFSLDFHFH
ncbi:MAG: TonB-dependent receptor [bacterium]